MLRNSLLALFTLLAGLATPLLAAGPGPTEESEKAVVLVVTDLGEGASLGTGFLVAPNRMITNFHVVDGGGRFFILPPLTNDPLPVKVLWTDPDRDLALLEVPDFGAKPLPITLVTPVRQQHVWSLGYGAMSFTWQTNDKKFSSTPSEGIVQNIFQMPWGQSNRPQRAIQHSADIEHGNSGGPLLDDCGRIIGVNTAGPPTPGPRTFLASPIDGLKTALEATRQSVSFTVDARVCGADGKLANPTAQQAGGLPAHGRAPWASQPVWVYVSAAIVLLSALALVGRRFFTTARGTPPPIGTDRPPPPAPNITYSADGAVTSLRPLDGGAALTLSKVGLERRYGLTIGRSPDFCDLLLSGATISRRHVRLTSKDGAVMIEDLNSAHGSRLGAVELKPFECFTLRAGDIVHIGDRAFRAEV